LLGINTAIGDVKDNESFNCSKHVRKVEDSATLSCVFSALLATAPLYSFKVANGSTNCALKVSLCIYV